MRFGLLILDDTQRIFKYLSEVSLPIKEAYIINGLIKQINNEMLRYEQTRTQILLKFGELDANNNLILDTSSNVKLSNENKKQFVKELNELLASEANLNKISLEIKNIDNVKVSAKDISTLEMLIDFT